MNNLSIDAIAKQLCEDIAIITSTDKNKINRDDSLASLGIDSLSLVEIFVSVENNFKIKLLEADLSNDDLKSIDSLSKKIFTILNV